MPEATLLMYMYMYNVKSSQSGVVAKDNAPERYIRWARCLTRGVLEGPITTNDLWAEHGTNSAPLAATGGFASTDPLAVL